jgi:hypothetical protein
MNLAVAASELLRQVEADGFALAIGVRREEDLVRLLRFALELGENLLLFRDHDVVGLEAVLDVDPELALGQIADVSHRGPHHVIAAQELVDRLRLGGRLDDDQ